MFWEILLSMAGNVWLCWHLGGDVGDVARGATMEIRWWKHWRHRAHQLTPRRRCLCLSRIMSRLANDLEEAFDDPVGGSLKLNWRIDTVQVLLGLPRSLQDDDIQNTIEELRWMSAQLSWLANDQDHRSEYREIWAAVQPWVGCNLIAPPPPRARSITNPA